MTDTISVRKVTWKYLAIILVLSTVGLLLLARMGWQAIEEDKRRHNDFESNVLQNQFSQLLGFYQGIARQLSKQGEVADILLFGDRERAVAWARGVTRLIPESIGVALVDGEGQILGEPPQLNLGTQCVSDLATLLAGGHVGSPPVHRLNPEFSHFDITHEVVYQGEVVGLLFISFSLDVVRSRAAELIGGRQLLIIEDGEGISVAVQGEVGDVGLHGEHRWRGITGTDWRLHYMDEEQGANPLFSSTLLIIGIFLLATVGVMVVLSMRLIVLFKGDLALIKEQLDGVYAGNNAALPLERQVLTETRDIMEDVWAIMGKIEMANSRLKEMSVNDELSGLLNRRGFNERLEQTWELSSRGATASLVLLDLDYFKQVNDTLGHSAGDEVIKALARALSERCRKSDAVARLGGDEFAVILNSTAGEEALHQWYNGLAAHFDELQADICAHAPGQRCTISAGAVAVDKQRFDWLQKQIDVADRALYRAKELGRARIICNLP